MTDVVKWRQTDAIDVLQNCPDHDKKFLFYGRTYTPYGGFTASVTNDLILNFKMGRNVTAARVKYREQAIARFAAEAATFFANYAEHLFAIVPATTSHPRSSPESDDRLDRVGALVAERATNVVVLPILDSISARQPHHSGAPRDVNELVANTRTEPEIERLLDPARVLVVLDDVLRTGATFEACRRVLAARFPSTIIIGLFWANAR